MEDKKVNTKLYIPTNVKTRFEFIRGFGINELIVTSIVVAFLIGIALIIYSFTNELIVPVLIVLLGAAAMVIITAKDTNNLSVLDMIKNMLEFAGMQINYEYKYFDKWREKLLLGLLRKKDKDIITSSAQQEIKILDIKNNLIYTRDNLIIAILKINSLNMQLFSKKELLNKVKDITSELSTETKEFKMTSIARPVDVGSLIDFLRNILSNSTDSIQKRLLRENIRETLNLTLVGDAVERQNLLIISENLSDNAEKDIQKRAREIVQKFDNCGMKLEILNDQYLIQVCNSFTNMSVATKEDSDYQDYIPHLVA